MEITVQKYGGSSLATEEQVVAVARRLALAHRRGAALIVVVSARGDTTDELVRAAAAVSATPDPAEADKLLATGENASAALLAIAVRGLGVPAVSLTGPQAGLRAAGRPGRGMVSDVDTGPVRELLATRHVVIVAGFQAATDRGEVITLGRGGSDTSAVALAVAHGAPRCEIYTDVDGIRRADPRLVPGPALLTEVGADVMGEMAFAGARVMHTRAVELAAAHGVDIAVHNAADPGAGSTIIGRRRAMLDPVSPGSRYEGSAGVTAITHDLSVAQLVVATSGELLERAAVILDALARRQIVVDSVVWRTGPDQALEMTCLVARAAATEALAAVSEAGGGTGQVRSSVGTVSVVGIGLLSRPGLTALALRAFVEADIDAECVSATQARTTFLVDSDCVPEAVGTLYHRFELGDAGETEQVLAVA